MMILTRIKSTWLSLTLAMLVILGCIRTMLIFPYPETGIRNDIKVILEGISVADLIAMVFWEKNSGDDLESDIIVEKSKDLRDQECPNYDSLKYFFSFNIIESFLFKFKIN
jgi:hypothetical protein